MFALKQASISGLSGSLPLQIAAAESDAIARAIGLQILVATLRDRCVRSCKNGGRYDDEAEGEDQAAHIGYLA